MHTWNVDCKTPWKARGAGACKGVRRQRPRARDVPILNSVGQSLVKNACEYDQLLIYVGSLLPRVFGFMRSGELTVPEGTIFDPARHLTPKDIMVDDRLNPTMLKIRLKTKKKQIKPERVSICLWVGLGTHYALLWRCYAICLHRDKTIVHCSVREMEHTRGGFCGLHKAGSATGWDESLWSFISDWSSNNSSIKRYQ